MWLRINHWDSQGRRARLCAGVLHHVGNRTLTFHGSATTVKQLLLPLGHSPLWLLSHQCLRWATSSGAHPCLCRPLRSHHLPSHCAPSPLCQGTPQPLPSPPFHNRYPQPSHTSPLPRLSGAHLDRSWAHLPTRGFKLKSTAWLAQLPLHAFHALQFHPLPPVLPPRQGPTPGGPFTFSPCCSASTSLS